MVEKVANVRLDNLVDTDVVNLVLVLHLLEGTNEFLRIVVLLKPDDEFLLHQLRVFWMMFAKSNADSIRHCSVLCFM
jgi:hypothetical protein